MKKKLEVNIKKKKWNKEDFKKLIKKYIKIKQTKSKWNKVNKKWTKKK